jgi:hypothetical protein
MDVRKALFELYEEKKRLDRAIDRLEARLTALLEPAAKKRHRAAAGRPSRKKGDEPKPVEPEPEEPKPDDKPDSEKEGSD